jgi:hypothetical protein
MRGCDVLEGMRAVMAAIAAGGMLLAGCTGHAAPALSASAAVYIDYCAPCGYGTGPWDLVTADGAALARKGNVGGLTQPVAASFLTAALGWVVGTYIDNRDRSRPRRYWRVVTTSDGGRTWRVELTSAAG